MLRISSRCEDGFVISAKISTICLALTASLAHASEPRPGATIERASHQLLALRENGESWSMPAYLGTHYLSQYFVMQRWLRIESSKLKPDVLRALLLDTQQADGSWQAVYDATYDAGDLGATVLNYWALKVMGEDTESRAMSRARRYILERGGVDAAPVLTKVFLALADNYAWSKLPRVPYLLFLPLSPVNVDHFAQWVGPHLKPLAYLRQVRASRQLGPEYDLRELHASPPASFDNATPYQAAADAPADHRRHIKDLLNDQQPLGSWGGYTTATILSLAAAQDFATRWPLSATDTTAARTKALDFLEGLYLGSGKSAYLGVASDGIFWDTALAANALLDAGTAVVELAPTMSFLVANQQTSGGFPFGRDFWYKPDVDDTAMHVLALARFPEFEKETARAVSWLVSMQNADGGFAAFDKDNVGNFMLNFFAGEFADSADLFDESSADVTGHVLEAFARTGLSRSNSVVVQRAIRYLRGAQRPDGSFEGRWGVNTLYGTGAATVGLVRAGLPVDDGMVVKALGYLASKQNADGGFGETSRSYVDSAYAGKGESTPTQTAWALLALLEHRDRFASQVDRAVAYLIQEHEKHGRWLDRSAVGTGHPGLVPMQYPAYAWVFPLQALARYQRQRLE